MAITAAADGSALGNPGPAGWAWYVDDQHWRAGGWQHGTNNMGELMAVIDLAESTAHSGDELVILCDSRYVIDAVTKWLPGWKRNGWRKADGKPVLNRELLERLDSALTNRRFRMEWVKGHAGHPLNEAADTRARAAATAYQNNTRVDTGPGWTAPSSLAEQTNQVAGSLELFDSVNSPALADLTHETTLHTVSEYERELATPTSRSDRFRIGELLHPDFEEIGRSGRMWSRVETIEMMSSEGPSAMQLTVLNTAFLSNDVILVTSRSTDERGATLRNSVWVRHQGQWRLRLHQGTAEAQ